MCNWTEKKVTYTGPIPKKKDDGQDYFCEKLDSEEAEPNLKEAFGMIKAFGWMILLSTLAVCITAVLIVYIIWGNK